MIKVTAVGGYNDIGKNSTAIHVDDEIVIVDLGIHLENYIQVTEADDLAYLSAPTLASAGATPDISPLEPMMDNVKAVIIGHAHLDHMGAVPYLANHFQKQLICTPYTAQVLEANLTDTNVGLIGGMLRLSAGMKHKISDKITVEFVHITHSIPHTVLVVLHTPYGKVVYANDFKLDNTPTFGPPPDYDRMRQLGEEGVHTLVCESTYAPLDEKTPSEASAKEKLQDVLLKNDYTDNLLMVTTFSSHMARIRSIVECANQLNRKVVFMGRSLAKYVYAAHDIDLIDFGNQVEIIRFPRQIKKKLKEIELDRGKYLLVVTGHQGEKNSTLYKLSHKNFSFDLQEHDTLVFSCRTIPTETNQKNRAELEQDLRDMGLRLFLDIHESGHAAAGDLREFLDLIKPQNIVPSHGDHTMKEALRDLAVEKGYQTEKIHLISDGETVEIQ